MNKIKSEDDSCCGITLEEQYVDDKSTTEMLENSEVKIKQEGKESDPFDPLVDTTKCLEEKKSKFEKARDQILADIPHAVKACFGNIFFSQFGKQTLPCLAMNPYSVPPGGARNMWLEMYHKVKANNRLEFMSHLVYWYGSSNDPTNAFSLLASKKMTPYETAVQKKWTEIPEALLQKYKEGKLSAARKTWVHGMMEMKDDLAKAPHERFGGMSSNFVETYATASDDENEQVEESTKQEGQRPKRLQRTKRKAMSQEIDVPSVAPKKSKLKKLHRLRRKQG